MRAAMMYAMTLMWTCALCVAVAGADAVGTDADTANAAVDGGAAAAVVAMPAMLVHRSSSSIPVPF